MSIKGRTDELRRLRLEERAALIRKRWALLKRNEAIAEAAQRAEHEDLDEDVEDVVKAVRQ